MQVPNLRKIAKRVKVHRASAEELEKLAQRFPDRAVNPHDVLCFYDDGHLHAIEHYYQEKEGR